ncbi:MAG TPA: hypothetical protein VNT79_07265, partial [Phycisphaerae bacterium]|nr:hypothetical protein [Phycisphaerae bacterium]
VLGQAVDLVTRPMDENRFKGVVFIDDVELHVGPQQSRARKEAVGVARRKKLGLSCALVAKNLKA